MKKPTLKKITSFTFLLVFSFLLLSAWSTGPAPSNGPSTTEKKHTINPVIGDISFTSKFGIMPSDITDENLRISTHFEYVLDLLRQKDVSNLSPEQMASRAQLIELLDEYRCAGKFPRNYDYVGERKPCFIDKDNTICAVGYLVEQTVNRQTAEYINSKFKYEEVLGMHDDVLDKWISTSGLSKEEVAMIQPTYGGGYPPACPGNKVYACRYSNCVWECKCINVNQVDNWQNNAHPCDTTGNNGNGNGGGNGNGNGNGGDGPQGNIFADDDGSFSNPDASIQEIYPNPASSSTSIIISVPRPQDISIQVFDLQGKLVQTIAQGERESGIWQFTWNIEDVSPGIYLLRMAIGQHVQVEKLSVLN